MESVSEKTPEEFHFVCKIFSFEMGSLAQYPVSDERSLNRVERYPNMKSHLLLPHIDYEMGNEAYPNFGVHDLRPSPNFSITSTSKIT